MIILTHDIWHVFVSLSMFMKSFLSCNIWRHNFGRLNLFFAALHLPEFVNCLKFLLIFRLLFFALPFGGRRRIVIGVTNFITIICKKKHRKRKFRSEINLRCYFQNKVLFLHRAIPLIDIYFCFLSVK